MKFDLLMRNEISGALQVTAETPAEVAEVFKHFRLVDTDNPESLLRIAEAIKAGTFTHVDEPRKRFWFDVDVYLDRALDPYRKLLNYCTGYDGEIPDMELTAAHPNRLCHTHITDTCELVDGGFHAHVYIQSEEWNKQDAATRAQINADDYTQEDIGKRKHEREFIANASGNYNRNPNYLKRHRAEPGLGADWLWSRIFAWWRSEVATPEQRAVLDAVDALREGYTLIDPEYSIRKGGGEEASLVGYSLHALDPTGTCNYDGKGKMARVYKWEEFRALGKVAV